MKQLIKIKYELLYSIYYTGLGLGLDWTGGLTRGSLGFSL